MLESRTISSSQAVVTLVFSWATTLVQCPASPLGKAAEAGEGPKRIVIECYRICKLYRNDIPCLSIIIARS